MQHTRIVKNKCLLVSRIGIDALPAMRYSFQIVVDKTCKQREKNSILKLNPQRIEGERIDESRVQLTM